MNQQQAAFEYIRAGQIPFFRLEESRGSLTKADAVLLGVPFDGGTTYQPGARFAPYAVRRVSALVQSYHPVHELDVFRSIRVLDGGNVPAPPFHPHLVREMVQSEVASVLRAGAVPVVIGGDHSVTLPAMREVSKAHGELAVVHVDAHFDTSGAEVWGDDFHHGTPLRHALTEKLVAPSQLHQIGIRAPWGHPEEGQVGAQFDAHVYDMDAIEHLGIDVMMSKIVASIGDRPVYLTFDIDAIDPAFAPGTGTPVPGGITAREALRIVRMLAGLNVVGCDLMEVAPALDHADITAHLAAHLLYEMIALVAVRRRVRE